MLSEIRFGLRMLARNPSLTALATIALALGIGGSAVIFSVVNAVLLRPLPFPDPDRLVWIWANSPSRNLTFAFAAYSTYAEWIAGSPSFESISTYAPASATLLVNSEPISRVTPMTQYVSEAVGTPRLSALLLAAFGMTALLLAAVGIYGVISFSVARRMREIGVRIALGAAGRDVIRMVVAQALVLSSLGVAIGIGGAFALTGVMKGLLFGVTATDPFTYLAVSVLLVAIAALAAYVPARRAARINPSVALRYE